MTTPKTTAGTTDPMAEGMEILVNLMERIGKHGPYSKESMVGFIDQALQCFREASRAASPRDDAGVHSCPCGSGPEPCPGPDGVPLCVYPPDDSATAVSRCDVQNGDDKEPIGYAAYSPVYGWRVDLAAKNEQIATAVVMRSISGAAQQGWEVRPIYGAASPVPSADRGGK